MFGAGTIGLLAAMFARARGAEVHLLGRSERSLSFARSLGFANAWSDAELPELPELPWDAVIDASNAPELPRRAVELVEPGRRIVLVGLAGSPSLIDTRALALADVTAVGILSASPGLTGTIDAYASGAVDPRGLVAATVSLDDVPAILAGQRPAHAGPGPKFHIDIRSSGGNP
ncbi:zinc-binding dehydrogenase [Leifsonia poae]|uniref:zinc-binding dehydrogenase n=1 Tax=Leifsonia poae TaxID=110933 RepID=UPI001CC19BB5|nr:zinc-binding dehydrogenase [Leifsonia poae]